MNTDQIASILRSGLKLLGAYLLLHGKTDLANWLGSPEVANEICNFAGPISLGIGLLLSHFKHGASGAGSQSKVGILVIFAALGLCFGSVGCKSTPQQIAYQSAGTTQITVEAALRAYDVFAAQGKTTPAMNAKVKAAYVKYQKAMALLCDAGAVYAATSATNAPAASEALSQAVANVNQEVSDTVALVQSFGVKITN